MKVPSLSYTAGSYLVPGSEMLPRRLWAELVQWGADYRCVDCGRDREQLVADGMSGRLNAHHLDGDDTNNRLTNGLCVCPSCHQKRHVRGAKPCEPGCTCGRHSRHERDYHGSKSCPEGCTCKKHDQVPAVPFTGAANFCEPGCTCGRHTAMVSFRGPRAPIRSCRECPRRTRKITRGLCPACYQKFMRDQGRIGARSAA